jgi:hypothetical protein
MPSTWVFHADPAFYQVDEALRAESQHMWLVQQHRKEIHAGDKVYIWRGGEHPAILAKGKVMTEPAELEPDPESNRFLTQPLRFSGKRWRVWVQSERFPTAITRMRMTSDPTLKSWYVLQGLQGTNFKVSAEIEEALEKLVASLSTKATTGQ